jgi:phosphohistidine phosphatase
MPKPPDYFYNQAAALPILETEEGTKVILISTQKGKWTLPKGVIDPGDSPHEAALREALEEAGLEGEIHPKEFARFKQKKWGGKCTIRVHILKVSVMLEEWPEKSTRKRILLPLNQSINKIVNRQKPVIEKLRGKGQTIHNDPSSLTPC